MDIYGFNLMKSLNPTVGGRLLHLIYFVCRMSRQRSRTDFIFTENGKIACRRKEYMHIITAIRIAADLSTAN